MSEKGCPCEWVEPCSDDCSCANAVMSGGCTRCCKYGSDEQRLAAATELAATLDDSCGDERMRLAIYDRTCFEAAKAIKESDHWADNHWPSMVERLWYTVAQEEIKSLREALRGASPHQERA